MGTPSNYYALNEELEAVKARAFLLLMSGEVAGIDGPLASALFDLVGDQSEDQAKAAIKAYEETGS